MTLKKIGTVPETTTLRKVGTVDSEGSQFTEPQQTEQKVYVEDRDTTLAFPIETEIRDVEFAVREGVYFEKKTADKEYVLTSQDFLQAETPETKGRALSPEEEESIRFADVKGESETAAFDMITGEPPKISRISALLGGFIPPDKQTQDDLKALYPGASLIGKIGQLGILSLMTGGIAPATTAYLETTPVTLYPKLIPFIANALQRSATWGMGGIVDVIAKEPSAESITHPLSEAAFGAMTGGIHGIENTSARVLAGGIARGGWSAGKSLLKDGNLDKGDLTDVAVNVALGAAFELINAPVVSRRYKEARMTLLNRIKDKLAEEKGNFPLRESLKILNQYEAAMKQPAIVMMTNKVPLNLNKYSKTIQEKFVDTITKSIKDGKTTEEALAVGVDFLISVAPPDLTDIVFSDEVIKKAKDTLSEEERTAPDSKVEPSEIDKTAKVKAEQDQLKVVSEEAVEGKAMFHSTTNKAGIEKSGFSIDETAASTKPVGVWFTTEKQTGFGDDVIEAVIPDNLYKVSPTKMDKLKTKARAEFPDMAVGNAITKYLQKEGYDGLDMEGTIVVFDPAQIKTKAQVPAKPKAPTEELKVEAVVDPETKLAGDLVEKAKEFKTFGEFSKALKAGKVELDVPEGIDPDSTALIDQDIARDIFNQSRESLKGEEGVKDESIRVMRRNIRALAAIRGFSKKELGDIIKARTGASSLIKSLDADQLKKILDSVKKRRPKFVAHKKVITLKTEKKIRTLKDTLIKEGSFTQELFDDILRDMNIKDPRFVSPRNFITEQKGQQILKTMNSLVPLFRIEIEIDKGYEKNPAIASVIDKMETNFGKEFKDKPVAVNSLLDAHHFYDSIEKQSGIKFGTLFEKIFVDRKIADRELGKTMQGIMRLVGDKEYHKIINDKKALDRIERYMASKLPQYVQGRPEVPKDITESEKKIADGMADSLKAEEDNIRFDRFLEWYDEGTKIPNAPEKELNKGKDIFETLGAKALMTWIKTRQWGIIRSGYTPGEVFTPKIRAFKGKPGFSKKGLKIREKVVWAEQDRDIVTRFYSYTRQRLLRNNLRPTVRALQSLWETNSDLFKNPRDMNDLIEKNIKELLGQRDVPQILEKVLIQLYSQAATTIFSVDPRKGIRNLPQNAAFFTSFEDMFKMKPLTASEKEFFETFVSQEQGIKKDFLYVDRTADIPGLKTLNDWASVINMMGRTDTINRYVAFNAKVNAIKDALKRNPDWSKDDKSLEKLMKDSGLGDLDPMERVHALQLLATEGEEAYGNYIGLAITRKVHFLYERFQRGPAEQGSELSRVLSNLLTFKKGYAQATIKDIAKLRPSRKETEKDIGGRRRGARSAISRIIMGLLVGAIYQKITGDKRNPYAPDEILKDWGMGGLSTGAQEKMFDFTGSVVTAMSTGDKGDTTKVINNITSVADTFIPFYKIIIDAIESGTEGIKIDKKVLKQIRAAVDKRFDVNRLDHIRQRSLIEKGQHAFFGTDPEKKKPQPIFK